MIKAIIFDCFGVVLTDALQIVREELALTDPTGALAITDIVAANNRGMLDPKESNQQIAEILGLSVDEFRAKIASGEVRNTALLNYIVQLKKEYKTAMLSNIAGSSLRRRFPNDELSTYFDVVVASGDIGYVKPEASAYEAVAEQLGVRLDECVFTDDRELFCSAAEGVGMRAIVYAGFAQFRSELQALLADSKN